jgi:hypothetical protein
MISTPASYSIGLEFKSRPENCLSWLRLSVVFLSPSRQCRTFLWNRRPLLYTPHYIKFIICLHPPVRRYIEKVSSVLDAVVKRTFPSPRRESIPRPPIVQSVAQRYTDWAITARNEEGKRQYNDEKRNGGVKASLKKVVHTVQYKEKKTSESWDGPQFTQENNTKELRLQATFWTNQHFGLQEQMDLPLR